VAEAEGIGRDGGGPGRRCNGTARARAATTEKSLQEVNQRAAQTASDATHGANIETTLTRLRESAEAATARAEAVNAKIESAQQQLAQSVEEANQRARPDRFGDRAPMQIWKLR